MKITYSFSKNLRMLVIFASYISLASCGIQNERDCGGSGGIIVNKELYSNISLNVGDTLIIDLLGEPPVFRHPNNFSISISGVSNTNSDVVSMTIDPNSNSTESIIIIGKSTGSSALTLMAEDECAGELNPKFKKINIKVN